MAEYIEREAAIKAIDHEVSLDGLYANIRAIPAADVRPERHGKWKEYSYNEGVFYCSLCGERSPCNWDWIFCPNCGAKMDGKDGKDSDIQS